ncbi:hypothetical protein C0J52_00310 [Blattella germanica]|nr:hypothetical protein C0J52_00310 [Blattella germanica]
MFFEGSGCSVLLRGATTNELAKLKRVVSRIVFTEYSWRLEKSFLMDEFARPPSPPTDNFFGEPSQDELSSTSPSKSKLCLSNDSPLDKSAIIAIPNTSPSKNSENSSDMLKENIKNKTEMQQKDLSNKTGKSDDATRAFSESSNYQTNNEQSEVLKNDKNATEDERYILCNTKLGESKSSQCVQCGKHINMTVCEISSERDLSTTKQELFCQCKYLEQHNDIEGNDRDTKVLSEQFECNDSNANKTHPNRISSKEKSLSEEKRMNVESVSDFSDPLHLYLNLEDEVFNTGNQNTGSGQWLSVAELPLTNRFRKALDDTILSSSPYLKFTVPYLETEPGRNCALRKFFPEEIFWSAQFDNITTNTRTISSNEVNESQILQEGDSRYKEIKLTNSIDNREIQTMVAHFRACGGRVYSNSESPEPIRTNKGANRNSNTNNNIIETSSKFTLPAPVIQKSMPDALDPANHQRLPVLFCNYQQKKITKCNVNTEMVSDFVNTLVVFMEFYGHNDIPLGSFLERYCFESAYVCPSKTCDTPMVQHVRRFVHDLGCVHLKLIELDKPIPDTEHRDILMWSWCSKCNERSPVVQISADTWALSFAKYLELRFHGGMYKRRGQEGTSCSHSLHHEHCQYFAVRNIVASFKYTNIALWEVSLPPPLITTYYDPQQQSNVIEEIKLLALKGYEVYSCILEKLCTFGPEVDEIQLKLTSPTLEAKKLEGEVHEKDVQQLMWRIEDSVVQLKRLIVDVVTTWNTKIQDLLLLSKRRDEKHRKSESGKPSAPTTSHSLEYDRVSSSSSHFPDEVVETMPIGTSTAHWDDTSSCSEGREDMSPSSPEPPNIVGTGNVLDSSELDPDDSLSSGMGHDSNSSIQVAGPADSNIQNSDGHSPFLESGHIDTPGHSPQTLTSCQGRSLPSSSPRGHSPLSPQEHHLAPTGCSVPVVVYENEPSSIIAYALSSQEYQGSLDEILSKKNTINEQATPSPVHKRKSGQSQIDREFGGSSELLQSSETRRSGVLSFLRGSNSANSGGANSSRGGILDGVQYSTSPASDSTGLSTTESDDTTSNSAKNSSSNFFCRVYFVEQFANLRQMVLPTGEEGFVRSLTRCVQWVARGGKFILKEMSRLEMQLFLDFAPNYFNYIQKCHATQQATLLGKIVGVYRIVYRNVTSNATLRSNLLVMENLFYSRSVTHKFDLKGSVRNRLVNPTAADRDGEIVLMDENLLNMTCDDPLYILPHSKTVLTHAINNDTQFLASQSVMDYSLLVGLDKERRELVVGIIDYIRTFTWDKKLETMVKSSGILGGQGKLPTVVSPELYRARFIEAMHRYFLPVPDRWTGLGNGLEC